MSKTTAWEIKENNNSYIFPFEEVNGHVIFLQINMLVAIENKCAFTCKLYYLLLILFIEFSFGMKSLVRKVSLWRTNIKQISPLLTS